MYALCKENVLHVRTASPAVKEAGAKQTEQLSTFAAVSGSARGYEQNFTNTQMMSSALLIKTIKNN